MEKFNAYLVSGMMALAVFSSCKNEDAPGFNQNENVQTAIASFRISLGGAGSRAGEGIAGTLEEQKVKDITLLVFSTKKVTEGEPAAEVTKADKLESAERIEIKDATGTYKMNVMTTEGDKVIFAIANNPTAEGNAGQIKYAIGQAYNDFINQEGLKAVTGKNNAVALQTISDNGFQMISEPQMITVEGYATETETEAAAQTGGKNNFPISISRLSSKVQVMFADQVKSDEDFEPADVEVSVATDPAPVFTAAQLQTLMYLEPKKGGYDDANTPAPTLTQHIGENAFVAEDSWFKTETTTGWSGVAEKSAYVSENIIPVATPLRKYATAVILKTKLNITKFNKSDNESNTTPDADGSFYAVCKFKNADGSGNLTEEEQVYSNLDLANPYAGIFPNVRQANAYLMNELSADQVNYAVVKFPGGYAYYRVNLTNYNVEKLADVYSVPRNSYYHINVKSLKNVGWDNPADLVDPNDENEVKPNKVSISADINVQPWIPINMDESLQ